MPLCKYGKFGCCNSKQIRANRQDDGDNDLIVMCVEKRHVIFSTFLKIFSFRFVTNPQRAHIEAARQIDCKFDYENRALESRTYFRDLVRGLVNV